MGCPPPCHWQRGSLFPDAARATAPLREHALGADTRRVGGSSSVRRRRRRCAPTASASLPRGAMRASVKRREQTEAAGCFPLRSIPNTNSFRAVEGPKVGREAQSRVSSRGASRFAGVLATWVRYTYRQGSVKRLQLHGNRPQTTRNGPFRSFRDPRPAAYLSLWQRDSA